MSATSRSAAAGVAAALLVALLHPAGAGDGAAPVRLIVAGEQVSAHLEGVPLGAALQSLSEQSGIQVHVPQAVAGQPVSARFDDLPLEQALMRLLEGVSHIVLRDDPGGAPIRVWVLSSGHGMAPGAGAHGTSPPAAGSLAFDARHAPEPEDRSAALVALSAEDPAQFVAVLSDALNDRDPSVRETAMDLVAYSPEGQPLSRDAKLRLLTHIARSDGSAELRADALVLLADMDPERGRAAALHARGDADAGVRTEAEAVLEELEAERSDAATPRRR